MLDLKASVPHLVMLSQIQHCNTIEVSLILILFTLG